LIHNFGFLAVIRLKPVVMTANDSGNMAAMPVVTNVATDGCCASSVSDTCEMYVLLMCYYYLLILRLLNDSQI